MSWLKRGKSLDDEWTMHELPCDEPMVHRVRVFDIDGDGKPEIVHVPLQGKGATAKGNYLDGRPVRVIALKIPVKDPDKTENWKPIVLSEELHVIHNFAPWPNPIRGQPPHILLASYEGLSAIHGAPNGWRTDPIASGNQANPAGSRGSSEVKPGTLGPAMLSTTISSGAMRSGSPISMVMARMNS
jgi:hypothetical protein